VVENHGLDLRGAARRCAPGVSAVFVRVRLVSTRKPIEHEVCPRIMVPPAAAPAVEDIPIRQPDDISVPLIERDRHFLTPIEAPFYDELKRTELTFAVQPWVEGPDRRYRPDFIVFYGGQAVVVELDGHEGHKSKEQRRYDAERERWFKARRLAFVRWTGSDVHQDVAGCVRELMDILRGSESRP
jgi:very-short-patch-repair endonuclease